jgi:hypothetical protein
MGWRDVLLGATLIIVFGSLVFMIEWEYRRRMRELDRQIAELRARRNSTD